MLTKYEKNAVSVLKDVEHLVSVWPSKRDPSCVLYVLTDQGVAACILEGFLDVGRLVANYIDHQFGSSQFSQFLICWFHL